jgi:hypothetical protein
MPGEYRLVWSTPGGGTGYSVFHTAAPTTAAEAQSAASAFHTFAQTILSYMPNEVSIVGDTEYRVLNDVTGTLTGVFSVSGGTGGSGSDTANYNRAAGARIDWGTNTIVGGRRLRGRTYIVPLGTGAFDSNGLVSAAGIAALANAGANLVDDLDAVQRPLVVWSRVYGQTATVTNVQIPPKGAILTGRRD